MKILGCLMIAIGLYLTALAIWHYLNSDEQNSEDFD